MNSISISFSRTQNLQYSSGFKGIAVSTDRKQFIENALGFKGISIGLNDIRGTAAKIIHYRMYSK
ncbi:hypothetical protein [Mucilaginibacter aquatilis]|uniref:Uncharacterized protein n=1 Tax=Mucilaginibacter aquatilis TaxID=1517760 RepID=A0A6I4I3M8_9SPHI|nr:hypothetical protein [Mucilaginibacter aquatilis]MVN89620.1 hypothetical protein [Mucilaginibacter aquatilis]